MLLCSILSFLILDWAYSQSVSDLCDKKQFSSFTYPSNRSVRYNQTTTLSDRFMRDVWYGIADFIIPSVQPASRHCGAISPIFLQSEPTFERSIVDVTACIRDCRTTMVIKALKCSKRLTVYKLKRPSDSSAAYCLDGIEPGELNFKTTVTVVTKLRFVPNSTEPQQEFIFDCSFPNPNRDTFVYKSTWYVDKDDVVIESSYSDYEDVNKIRSLTDAKLRNSSITTVGFQLHCAITTAQRTDQETRVSLPSTSKQTFIGMKVKDPVITIKEGGKATIMIKSEVPIGCAEDEGCPLTVAADIPEEGEYPCEPTATANGRCGILKYASDWINWQKLEITSTVTENYGQEVTQRKIFLRTDARYFWQPIWQNYFLEPVTINIVKDTRLIEGKVCQIYSDPYLRDFHSNCNSTFQLAGVFYLFKMDNVEVQVEVTNCSYVPWYFETGYCVCGVVVRVGRTAFMINSCNLPHWHIDYILCEDDGDIFDVRKRSETMVKIYLPSGAIVEIDLKERISTKYKWLNINIYPSVRDIGKTSGLCGNLTANPTTVKYNLWRVPDDLNLFISNNGRTLPEMTSGRFQHCSCDDIQDKIDPSVNCSPVPGATNCTSETDYTLFHKKRCISPLRKKRSLPRASNPQILHHQRLKRDVSWKNGWTMNSASEYCSGLFNKSMVIKRCERINGIDIEGAIGTCVSDIQLSGSDAFALSAISSVSSQCLHEARMNQTLREEKVDNGKTILELVKEVACPGECSEQGLCEDGKCICNSGYIGSDCSVSVNTPPVAHNLEADGHCDVSLDDCTEVAVFGGRFVDAVQTQCKLLPFEIKNDRVTVSEEADIQTAVFESIGEVTCKLPSRKRRRRSVDVPVIDETVTGYKVSVSNNGQVYSQQLDVIIYNTECMNCSMDKIICSFSPDHCILNNICYGNGTIYNTGDGEFVCRADRSGKAWLRVKKGNVKEGKDITVAVVIGIIVTIVVIMVVIPLIIFCLKRKRRILYRRSSVVSPAPKPTSDSRIEKSTDNTNTIPYPQHNPYVMYTDKQ